MLARALAWLPRSIYRLLRQLFRGIAQWLAGFPEWIRGWLPDPSLERARELKPGRGLANRVDRLQRALDAELARSTSLNIRGTALAAGSALAILLLAQFSAVWLDDNSWVLSDAADKAQRILLYLSLGFLLICLLFAGLIITPRRRIGADLKARLDALNAGRGQEEAELLLGATEIQRASNERRGRHLRYASIPLALAIAAGVGQAVIFAHLANPVDRSNCASHDGAAERPSDDGLPSAERREELAGLFAPRVYFYPGEPWGPVTADDFVEAAKLVWNSPRNDDLIEERGQVEAEKLGADCEEAPGGCYQHNGCQADQVTRPSEQANRAPGLALSRGFALDPDDSVKRPIGADNPDVPTYYEFRQGSPGRLRLTYWFLEGNSLPRLTSGVRFRTVAHEGDWESIDVVLDADTEAPRGVFFYAHGSTPMRVEWRAACVVADDAPPRDPLAEDCDHGPAPGHPVVYSALLDHASYPAPNAAIHPNGWPCGFNCRDLTDRGLVWDTWRSGVLDVVDQPWWGFGGAWGAGGGLKGEIGPLGPSPWKQSSDPDPDESEINAAPAQGGARR